MTFQSHLLCGMNAADYVVAHWRGDHSVARAFWINGILFDAALIVVYGFVLFTAMFTLAFVDERVLLFPSRLAGWPMIVIQCPVTSWQLVGLWRSARRSFSQRNFVAPVLALLAGGGMTLYGVTDAARSFKDDLVELYRFVDIMRWRSMILSTRGGKELIVLGMIGPSFSADFQRALADNPNVRLVNLASGGGFAGEARKAAREIRRLDLATRAAGECSSACTMMLLAARERFLGPFGAIGFHGPSTIGASSTDDQSATIRAYEAELRSAGVSAELAHRASETPAGSMLYPTPAELLAAGVITRIEASSEAAEFVIPSRD